MLSIGLKWDKYERLGVMRSKLKFRVQSKNTVQTQLKGCKLELDLKYVVGKIHAIKYFR